MPAPATRDLVGYGGGPPHARWPGEARIAVNFVMDYDIARHWIATHPASGRV